MVLSGRETARMRATVDKMSDTTESGVLYMRFSQWKPNNSKTWKIEIPTPEKSRVPTQIVKIGSMLMESKMSEIPEMTAVLKSTTMQRMSDASILGVFCSGRRERWEAKAALTAAITATARLSTTAIMPNKIPKEYRE